MKTINAIILSAAVALTMGGCRSNTNINSESAYASFETVALSTDFDGSITVRAWGKGKNKPQALEQARRNALHDVIFKGITQGEGGLTTRPLIYEVNAQEKYEYYFNRFFAEGGEYVNYATFEDENRRARFKAKGKGQENWSTVIHVHRNELKQRLIEDGIIKP